jgi:HlyD family secretion protein
VKAPSDGIFYHGPIENGSWSPADLAKTLVPQGKAPLHKAYATFVPTGTAYSLVAFLDEATARSLTLGIKGAATLAGREDLNIPVKLEKLATSPVADGTFRADFSLTWPEGIAAGIGISAKISLISYQQAATISVPTKALHYTASGWSIMVKMADGKTEQRPVQAWGAPRRMRRRSSLASKWAK